MNTRGTDRPVGLAALAPVLAGCSATDERASADAGDGERDAKAASSGLDSTLESGFLSDRFVLTLALEEEGSELLIRGWEVDPATSTGRNWTMVERVTGSRIERAATNHANDWFVALRTTAGLVDIEHWTLERTTGAYFSARPPARTGIGVAVVTPDTVVGIEGGSYVAPAQRPRREISKSGVIRGLALDPIERMAVEPDARFAVLVLERDGVQRAVQIPLIDSSSFARGAVIPLRDLPELAHVASIGMFEQASTGRRALTFGGGTAKLCLWDAENDGIHEREELVSIFDWDVRHPPASWSRSW